MGKIGFGYGSEWHMLRWLGRHRQALNHQIQSAAKQNLGQIEWLDFPRSQSPGLLRRDKEFVGIDFISSTTNPTLHSDWKQFWPSSGNSHNWDAVGKFNSPTGQNGWLLVEAKAHTGELTSSCGASPSKPNHHSQMPQTSHGCSAQGRVGKKYYQYANRLAALHFFRSHQIDAHLVFVYFVETRIRDSTFTDSNGWSTALNKQHKPSASIDHLYSNQVHSVF